MAEGTVVLRQPILDRIRSRPEVTFGRFGLSSRRLELLVGALAFTVFGLRVWRPSPWRDEAVTVDVTHRSWGEVAHLLGHVDLVHAAHYLTMKALLGPQPGLVPMRMVSVAAAAATAVLLLRLGRALMSPLLGLGAAAVFIVLPLASRYAQEARSYAIVTMLVTAATLILVRAVAGDTHRRWLLYTGLIMAATIFHAFSIMILAPHGLYVLAQARAVPLQRWLRSVAIAGVVLCPFVLLTFEQRAQVSWIPPTQNSALLAHVDDTFTSLPVAVGCVAVTVYLGAVRRLTQVHLLAITWVALPAVMLWAVSQRDPLFVLRYLAFTMPGAALALAALAVTFGEALRERWAARRDRPVSWLALARARRVSLAAVLVVVLVSGFGTQIRIRDEDLGHTEDVRGAVALVDRITLPGDAVLFLPYDLRGIAEAYPGAFAGLDDVALGRSARTSATLFGVEARPDVLERRLDRHSRVVVLMRPLTGTTITPNRSDTAKLEELREHFTQVSEMDAWPFRVMVFDRQP